MQITESKIRELIRKNLISQKINNNKNYSNLILKENISTSTYSHNIIGKTCTNDYLKNKLKNRTLNLSKEYKKAKKLEITEIKYSQLESIDKNIILNFFIDEILKNDIGLSDKASQSIGDILIRADEIKGGTVFELFNADFPLQRYKYSQGSGNDDLINLAKFITDKAKVPYYNEIYKNKETSNVFSTGKGEYLCVLLTDGGKSGGTSGLDVQVGSDSYDLKQITQSAHDLKLTLSSSSGVKPKKVEFIRIYSELGQKLYKLKDELKELGISDENYEFINSTKGMVGTSLIKKTKDISSDDEEQFLGFNNLISSYKQALKGLRKRTYSNIQNFRDEKSKKNDNLSDYTTGTSNSAININIDQDFVKSLEDIYELKLININDLSISRTAEDAEQLRKILNYFEDIPGGFKRLKDDYNNARNNTCFVINSNYFPVITPIKSKINATEWNEIVNYVNSITSSDDCFKKIVIHYNTLRTKKFEDFQKNHYDNFRSDCNNYLNKQYLINNDEFKKFKDIKEGIVRKTFKNGYEIVEPINLTNTGEFVIDISYYKNRKKRHIDTLHSEDLKLTGKKITKSTTDKESRITGNVKEKDKESKLDIELNNVISDKDEINKKVKEYEMFSLLQPSILEKIYGNNSKNSKKMNIEMNTNVNKNYDISKISSTSIFETNPIDDDTKDFISDIKKIKDETNEENIFKLFIELYEAVDDLEEQIKKHYSGDHHIMVIKESSKDVMGSAYSWTEKIIDNATKEKGFVTGISDGILCEADPDQYNSRETIKDAIRKMYNEIYELTIEIQSTIRTSI